MKFLHYSFQKRTKYIPNAIQIKIPKITQNKKIILTFIFQKISNSYRQLPILFRKSQLINI